ncbi:MAG: hypothetical protein HKN30_00570 [Sulfitobacter sp.]|nr:hypothetical protein [Sulfitobacter sp.]
MTLAFVFGLIFLAGPLLFLLLSRARVAPPVLICGALGFFLLGLGLQHWGKAEIWPLTVLGLFWLAWIGTLAFAAVRLQAAQPAARRWTRVVGAVGTTVPWFGLATAAWMAG